MANEQYLVNLKNRTPEERSEIAKKGGKRSVIVKREKKMMSQIYAQVLADRYDVKIQGEDKKISGEKMMQKVISEIIMRRDASSVSMIKEIREATEGNKIDVNAELLQRYDYSTLSHEEKIERVKQLQKERENEGLH